LKGIILLFPVYLRS